MSQCATCSWFKQNTEHMKHLGECTLQFPPWVLRALEGTELTLVGIDNTVCFDYTCSFHDWTGARKRVCDGSGMKHDENKRAKVGSQQQRVSNKKPTI